VSFQLTIDNNAIQAADVKEWPKVTSKLEFNRNLIATECDIVLDNTDGTYSDTSATSIFYATNWMDDEVTIYDDAQEIYTWVGRIKNIIVDDTNRTVVVRTANYVREMADVTCVYTASAITPAEAVYEILTDVIGITDAYINYSGFQDGISVQTAASATVDITFTAEHNKSCMAVIQELLRMTQGHLYTVDNIIHYWQWEAYDGAIGFTVNGSDYIPATLKTEYDYTIYNAYSIYYDAAGTATKAFGTKSGTAGDKVYAIPDELPETTTSSEWRIIFDNSTGAAWAGALAMTRYQYPGKICSFSLDNTMNFLEPNQQADLYFGDYIREPVRINEITYDQNAKKLSCKGQFLNLPVNTVSRDTEPPDNVELAEVLPIANGLFVKWSQSHEVDHLGYYVYLAAGEAGSWNEETTNLGQSPIEVKNPSVSVDGYAYINLYELTAGCNYYVKVNSFDTSYNESDDSNVLFATPLSSADVLYCLSGSIYAGLTLDILNALSGTVPDGYMTFDDLDDSSYDWDLFITAAYQSGDHFSETGFSSITWKSTSPDIYLKYAESDDGTTWTWSAEIDTYAASTTALSGKKYLKYIIIFYSESWDDTDTIYIKEIKEAA
jgi:hypothetical protein